MNAATLEQDTQRFVEHLRIERRCAPGTLRNYTRELRTLVAHAAAQGVHDWRELQPAQVQPVWQRVSVPARRPAPSPARPRA